MPRFRQERGGLRWQLSFPRKKSFSKPNERDSSFSKEARKQARCRHHYHYRSNHRSQKKAIRMTTWEMMMTNHLNKGAGDVMTDANPMSLPVLSPGTHNNWTRTNLLRPSHWQPTYSAR